jgi:hypothetical protein
MRYIFPVVDWHTLVKKNDWIQIQHKQVDGDSTRGRLRGPVGSRRRVELLTAIQVYA